MRHQVRKSKLNIPKGKRKLLLNNLATSLILHERINTTQAKAKALRPIVEKLIHDAKLPNKVIAIRRVNAKLQSEIASKKLIEDIAKRFQNKESGYTRITKIGYRAGDAASMAQIELTL